MKIEDYSFGKITIDGKTFTSDIKIVNGKVLSNWWRKDGHFLRRSDIDDLLKENLSHLVIGQGAYGVMKIDPALLTFIKDKGIIPFCCKTLEAVRHFNQLASNNPLNKIGGAFHLTC